MGNTTETILADADGIARAAEILRGGGLVAVPTETVYGLAARADSAEAVARIYAAKGRPDFNPLIVHVRDIEQAEGIAKFDTVDARLLADFGWPGPLTLVLPLQPDAQITAAVTAGLSTVALRVPKHPVMRQLLSLIDFPLAAPSANRSGFISPTHPGHVLESLAGRLDLILDGGTCARGVESTIVAVRPDRQWVELRPGPFDLQNQHDVWYDDTSKPRPIPYTGSTIEAPGQLESHYSPGKPVRLNARAPEFDEFMIGFAEIGGQYNLSEAADINLAAARIYEALHLAAQSDKPRIAVAPIPEKGIGRAINDRLKRAAA
ncbi:L-threonylcarbamoyladenylate synthase [Aurantiacibacter sp. D1-12]|uniref:L-threonylcarbamoyladenylate synthase n=1 Tax=Aurantiacibacter sp. D1-12 TaxID=2993658 RepID=UPI00237D0A9D|nr:L-threonylcarbamoyladenylate synthase [Aurantiacibacter sp. D1-12]MDE1468144.1 L-threonylcarbamoyladenylate synthase [Aurantiacibacter sp. D1-12]